MEKEHSESALEQVKNASKAGLVLHESRLCSKLNEEELEQTESILGKKGRYYYDPNTMTSQYATLLASLEEKDILGTVASMVREDSKKYPSTTPIDIFREAPFYFDDETINGLLARFNSDDQFKDINTCRASNGAIHLYSIAHLNTPQAEYLCEWHEVGRYENQ